jgi:hypothetical protein
MRGGREDVKSLVDQTIALLQRPDPRPMRRRLVDRVTGAYEQEREWRAEWVAFFRDLRERLDDPAQVFDDEAHHLTRWMDWDDQLDKQPPTLRQLIARIQDCFYRMERSL